MECKNLPQHQLCDDIADKISEFQDQVSEVEQAINGKLPFNKLKGINYKISNLKNFVEDVISETNKFYKLLKNKGDNYTGMRSDCESFISDMQRQLYLVNFTLKENKNKIGKKLIRLTEGDLHRIIENSVKRVLKETDDWEKSYNDWADGKSSDNKDWSNKLKKQYPNASDRRSAFNKASKKT